MSRMRTEREEALETAARWLVRIDRKKERKGDSETLRAACEKWLDADPRHREAYDELQRLWNDADEIGSELHRDPLQAAALESATAEIPRPSGGRRAWQLAAAAAAALLVAATVLTLLGPGSGGGYALRTGTGEQRELSLTDGSRVRLNAESKIHVRIDAQRREVELSRGEVLFTIASDPERPFVVRTRSGSVQAIGTEFDVRLRRSGTEVLVLEGRVLAIASDDADTGSGVELTAGETLRLDDEPMAAEAVDAAEIERVLGWRHGVLEFDDVPLSEVIRDLDPYVPGRLLLESKELGAMRVGGLLHLDKGHDPVKSLEQALPIRAIRFGNALVLLLHRDAS